MATSKKQFTTKGTNQIVKVLNQSKKGSIAEKTYKPRHGVSVRCPKCSWSFRCGGILDQKEATQREIAAIKKHRLFHQKLHVVDKKLKQFADPDVGLQIRRSHHAAEIGHLFDETATRQATTSTTYIDVPNAVISSGLTANQEHLVIVAAQVDMSSSAVEASIRMVRGTTPTVIDDSEATLECNAIGDRMAYNWWGVINPGGSAEDIKMQFKVSSATIGVDLITITVIKLTPDLTLNTDYRVSQLSTSQDYSAVALGADLTSGNATITHTPAIAGHKWLILGKSRSGTGIANSVAISSRIQHTGGATNQFPEARMEGEDANFAQYVMMTMRVDTLTAVSHTYTEISRMIENVVGATAAGSRSHSGIFMMDLDKFDVVSTPLQEDDTLELPQNLTAYAETVATTSITPAQSGDVLCLGYTTMDAGGSNFTYKMRMQVDNTDPQDIPTGSADDVTTKSYNLLALDTADRIPLLYSYVVEDLSTSAHTIDIDGSVNTDTGSEGTMDRSLVAFTMELEGGVAKLMVINNTLSVADAFLGVKGVQRQFLKTDTMTITDQFLTESSATSNLILPGNFVMRLSGGSSNTNGNASLGGVMSTAAGGVITDLTALWDPVNQTESGAGDTEYRLIYITNTHPSLTMYDVTLYISQNTPAADDIRLGVGSATTNANEPTVANENTAPSNVTFVNTTSLATGIHSGHLPAGQKKGIWVRRLVPAGTAAREANTYVMHGRFHSDPIGTITEEPVMDINGIEYPQPLLADGYELSFGNETFTFFQNFRTDGSMRCNFHGVRNSVMVAGYFKVDINTAPDGEEVSAEMNGGPHNNENPDWADNMDLGITNMLGTSSRVRWEATHPNYSSAMAPTYEELPLGSSVRGVWRGYIGLKINLDSDDDGQPDRVAIIGLVDIGGLNGSNVPVNTWVISYKRIFTVAETSPIKSPFTPYVATIGFPEEAENTIRIDDQIHADWTNSNLALRPYKYVTCKEVFVTNT